MALFGFVTLRFKVKLNKPEAKGFFVKRECQVFSPDEIGDYEGERTLLNKSYEWALTNFARNAWAAQKKSWMFCIIEA